MTKPPNSYTRETLPLQTLQLSNCNNLSDITALQGLTNLQWLALGNTPVTDDDEKKLQQALPNCKIYTTRQSP